MFGGDVDHPVECVGAHRAPNWGRGSVRSCRVLDRDGEPVPFLRSKRDGEVAAVEQDDQPAVQGTVETPRVAEVFRPLWTMSRRPVFPGPAEPLQPADGSAPVRSPTSPTASVSAPSGTCAIDHLSIETKVSSVIELVPPTASRSRTTVHSVGRRDDARPPDSLDQVRSVLSAGGTGTLPSILIFTREGAPEHPSVTIPEGFPPTAVAARDVKGRRRPGCNRHAVVFAGTSSIVDAIYEIKPVRLRHTAL